MTPLDVLRATRELLADPKRWTQQAYARDERGQSVLFHDPRATCWCINGAVACVAPSDPDRVARIGAHRALCLAIGLDAPESAQADAIKWNDAPERSHADVLKTIDAAIVAEGGGPPAPPVAPEIPGGMP